MLYVMASLRGGYYKLGHGDPERRIRSHQTSAPDMEFIAAVAHPSPYEAEQRVLRYFAAHNIGGENLDMAPEVSAWVKRFSLSPNVAATLDTLDKSWWQGESIMPWSPPPTLEDEHGQMVLPMPSGRYRAPRRRGAHQGQTSSLSEDWYTPPKYLDAVREVFGGTIDLDPMSCVEANQYVRAVRIYTAEVDGLSHPWDGHVYLNPPWGGSVGPGSVKRRAITKLISGYELGQVKAAVVCLNANATTTSWFAPLLSYHICFPNHRVEHWGPGGKGGAPNSGTVFIYLGAAPQRFAEVFRQFGAIMAPMAKTTASNAEDWDPDEESTANTKPQVNGAIMGSEWPRTEEAAGARPTNIRGEVVDVD
jgi:hypothetical protein